MNKQMKLGAGAAAVLILVGASAFAESRPQHGTRSEGGRISRGSGDGGGRSYGGGNRSTESRSRGTENRGMRGTENRGTRGTEPRGDRESTRSRGTDWPSEQIDRNRDRSNAERGDRGNAERGDRRNAERGDRGNRGDRGSYETFDSRRYTNRSRESADNRRYDHNRAPYGGRTPYYHNGRVSHFQRYGNGYRVWVGGATYPFFVPLSYWDPWRFRVGVSINLGGWWNPLGYYDYYDGYTDGYRDSYYRNDDYRDGRVYRTEQISGRVEDYDYRRRVALIRDDVTDRLVTVYMHSRDARLNHLRPGDYIEIEGGWKNGIFEAYRVFDVD